MKIHPVWYMCILTRSLIAYFIFIQPENRTNITNIIITSLAIISLGFFYKALTGSNNEVQISNVFWHNSRIVHGILYSLATICLVTGYPKIAYSFVLVDIFFSICYRVITDQ